MCTGIKEATPHGLKQKYLVFFTSKNYPNYLIRKTKIATFNTKSLILRIPMSKNQKLFLYNAIPKLYSCCLRGMSTLFQNSIFLHFKENMFLFHELGKQLF